MLLETTVLLNSTGPMNVLLLSSCLGYDLIVPLTLLLLFSVLYPDRCSIAGGAHSVVPAYLSELVGEQRAGERLGKLLPYLNGGTLLGEASQ